MKKEKAPLKRLLADPDNNQKAWLLCSNRHVYCTAYARVSGRSRMHSDSHYDERKPSYTAATSEVCRAIQCVILNFTGLLQSFGLRLKSFLCKGRSHWRRTHR